MTRSRWSEKRRAALFLAHDGACHLCGGKIGVNEAWEVEHLIPLAMDGDDDEGNCRPAHVKCHRKKTATDAGHIAKARRMERRQMGIKRQPRAVVPGSRASRWKRKLSGEVVRRDE